MLGVVFSGARAKGTPTWPTGASLSKHSENRSASDSGRIANETRIGMMYLEDLEEERFDRFPGEFYFQSFTKEYARSLGLNP